MSKTCEEPTVKSAVAAGAGAGVGAGAGADESKSGDGLASSGNAAVDKILASFTRLHVQPDAADGGCQGVQEGVHCR